MSAEPTAVTDDSIRSVMILIPVLNDQKALDSTLSSITGTDAEHATILIVDDGSTVPLVANFQFPGVRMMRLGRNVGIASALNEGLNFARSEGYQYILRLDAGDGYVDGRILQQLEFLEAHPNVAVVGTAAEYFFPETERTISYVPPLVHDQIIRQLRYHNPIIHPSIMLRVEAVDGGYSTSYPASEDYELYFRLALKWRLANLPQCLCRYEVNAGSISSLRRKRQLRNGIRLKLKYFEWSDLNGYQGLLQNVVRYLLPTSAARLLSRLRKSRMPSRW